MGLKTDIKNAFIKNITPEKDNDFEMSTEGKKKIDDLSEDLSKAISQFILKQDFQINNLESHVEIKPIKSTVTTTVTGVATPALIVTGTGAGTADSLKIITKGEVKKDGAGLVGAAAHNSLVKLNQVKDGSL